MRLRAREGLLLATPVVVVLAGWWLQHTGDQFDSKIRQLAGPGATDCGLGAFSPLNFDAAPQACMKRALHNRQPCFMRYEMGVPSASCNGEEDVIGVIGTSQGKVLMVAYHATRAFGIVQQQELHVEPSSAETMLPRQPSTGGAFD